MSGLFAERLQAAVGVPVHRLGGRVVQHGERQVLVPAGPARAGVGGDRGDLHVVAAAPPEGLRERVDLARYVRRRVDRRVPFTGRERRQVCVPVAEPVLGLFEQPWVRPAAMEDGHLVACGECGGDDVASDELGATYDEDAHRAILGINRALCKRGTFEPLQ